MAGQKFTPQQLVQYSVYGVESRANKVKRAEDAPAARRHLRALRKQVDELESRIMATFEDAERAAGEVGE